MSLAPREKRTVLIGLAIVLVVGVYMGVTRLRRALSGSTTATERTVSQFADARTRIVRYERVGKDLSTLTKDLHVEIPTGAPSDQMKRLVDQFEQLAGRSGVQIRNITQLKSQARATTARGPLRSEIKLDLTCPGFASLARFVDSLEQATVPIVVDQISITTTGGRTGSSGGSPRGGRMGGQPARRELQAALKIFTYLFPERAQQ
jgi:hypothetical protein